MSGITKLQGSLIVKEAVTIRVIRSGSDLLDLALTAGMEFDSVDAFLSNWATQLTATVSGSWTAAVNTSGASKGKVTIDAGSGTFNILWTHAGSATEGVRIRNFLGEAADASGVGASYTFAATHKAGFYPLLGASRLARTLTTYHHQIGVSADGSVWTQSDVEPVAQGSGGVLLGEGDIDIEIGLQLDGATDWSELGELVQFVDDVFDYMGEPWSVLHQPHGAGSADVYTGFFERDPIEVVAERRESAWDGLLDVQLRMSGRSAPGLQS